jgi:aspartate/methionine/tyrosine aminotransferase
MFGDPESDFIRISYLQPLPVIKEAMERIKGFIKAHKKATR